MKILNVVGARPNFVKIAPLHRAFLHYPDMHSRIVHTGQHHDFAMSGIFFEQLGIPPPDHFLGVSEASVTLQTAEIMRAFEKVVKHEMPDLVVVVGDVTSTLSCALVAAQMQVPLAHVEAGLRSGDRTMPEEMNRILTDAMAAELFATEADAVRNLLRENVDPARIHLVGNVMMDSLVAVRARLDDAAALADLGLTAGGYLLVTMHRPANVDHEQGLRNILAVLSRLGKCWPVVFVMHPRTQARFVHFCLLNELRCIENVKRMPPQGYIEFLSLVRHAKAVLTDSGGVQEETTFLQIPCITLRNSTERPVTVACGTNYLLADFDAQKVWDMLEFTVSSERPANMPPLWDGQAAHRIVNILREKYINS